MMPTTKSSTLKRADFCARLRQARYERQLTQTTVAKRAHLCIQTYNAIERGRRGAGARTLAKLCLALDVSADYLLGLPSHTQNGR